VGLASLIDETAAALAAALAPFNAFLPVCAFFFFPSSC